MADYGLIVFGGNEDSLELPNLFEIHFSKEKNLEVLEKVEMVPCTHACLQDPKVCHEIVEHDGVIDVDADPLAAKMADIVCMNTMACKLLLASGYADTSVFQKTLRIHDIAKKEAALTLPYSKERQEALLKASSHGQQFKITGGAHVTSNDFFISHQLGLLLKEIATLKSEKGQDWMLLLMKQRRLLS
jgi:hypothetical protein